MVWTTRYNEGAFTPSKGTAMKIIFCQDPVFEHEVDSMYIDEMASATRAGLAFELINYDALSESNNAARAVRDIAVRTSVEPAIYRGWPLSVSQYSSLYDALLSRGLQLINTAEQYRYTQHLPQSIPLIQAHTPKTIWLETDGKRLSYPAVMELLAPFGSKPIFLRDYAKSEKFYWTQASYIPDASDRQAVTSSISQFLLKRGKQFEGGLVFREFVEFKKIAESSPNQMPMIKEYRLFFLNGALIGHLRYWEGEAEDEPPANLFADIAARVRSRFFTMDLAQRPDGEWMIIDLGDAQLAKLPLDFDIDGIYHAFAEIT
jgi:hypothetical protein